MQMHNNIKSTTTTCNNVHFWSPVENQWSKNKSMRIIFNDEEAYSPSHLIHNCFVFHTYYIHKYAKGTV